MTEKNELTAKQKMIDDATLDNTSLLAKLYIAPEEREAVRADMAEMLTYIDELSELDTTGIEPMSHVFPVSNVFREDIVTGEDMHEAVLMNAPSVHEGAFKVPKTFA